MAWKTAFMATTRTRVSAQCFATQRFPGGAFRSGGEGATEAGARHEGVTWRTGARMTEAIKRRDHEYCCFRLVVFSLIFIFVFPLDRL